MSLSPNQNPNNFPQGLTVIPDGAQGPTFAVDRSGNLTISGTLVAATIQGTTEAATNLALSGNLTVGGTAAITGATTLTGVVTFGSTIASATITSLNVATITATGAVALQGASVINSLNVATLTASGATVLQSTLAVTGAATFSSGTTRFTSSGSAAVYAEITRGDTNGTTIFNNVANNAGWDFSNAGVAYLGIAGGQAGPTIRGTSGLFLNTNDSSPVTFLVAAVMTSTNIATLTTTGNTLFQGVATINSLKIASTTAFQTTVALTDFSGAQTATILNGPTAGNPTKWFQINDNGTLRRIPAW